MMNSVRSIPRNLCNWIYELFSLRTAERRISRLSLADRTDIRAEVERAVELMREADRTRFSHLRANLAKQALERLIVATATARIKARSITPVDWPDLDEAIHVLNELPDFGRHGCAIARVRGTMSSPLLTERQYAELADFFAFLEKLIDVRTPRDFRVTRWLRASALGVLIVCCGWFTVSPTNLARGKYVITSSLCSDMPKPPLGSPQTSRAVDGVRNEERFAICTKPNQNPWITVDLGKPYSIEEVIVYARTDGLWGTGTMQASIGLSLDNEYFKYVAKQTAPFTSDFPWRIKIPGKKARFVRLTADDTPPQELVISEIEVYER